MILAIITSLVSRPVKFSGEQGWRSGESARLPPMCPGFDSRTRRGESARLPPMCPGFDSRTRRHMWVEFVVGSRPCSEGFSSGSPVFLPPQKSKINISKFQFDREFEGHGFVCRPIPIVLVKCWKVALWNAKKLLKNCQKSKKLLPKFQKLLPKFLAIFI